MDTETQIPLITLTSHTSAAAGMGNYLMCNKHEQMTVAFSRSLIFSLCLSGVLYGSYFKDNRNSGFYRLNTLPVTQPADSDGQ